MINRYAVINYLIQLGEDPLDQSRRVIEFTRNPEANEALNDIEHYPHLVLLGFLMDKHMSSARAWEIPYHIREAFNLPDYSVESFRKLGRNNLERVFISRNLHRYPSRMARVFHSALEHVNNAYGGDAGAVWDDEPSSATLIRRLLQFDGMTLRDARSAANILFRYFNVPLSDASNLDITPDSTVRRVFQRLGFIGRHTSPEELIYIARELNPEWPGVFDHACWDVAERVCKPRKPRCKRCELNPFCPKLT